MKENEEQPAWSQIWHVETKVKALSWLFEAQDPNCGYHTTYSPTEKHIKATGEEKVFKYYRCANGKKVHKSLKGMRTKEDDLMNKFEPAI